MRYAFDLDGTLDVPAIAQLARDLHAAGHEIHVVTGAMEDTGEWTMAARREKLQRLNVPFTDVHRCFGSTLEEIGKRKAQVLSDLGIQLMFEDSTTFAKCIMDRGKTHVLFILNGNLKLEA